MDALSPEKRYCKVRKRKTKKCLDKLRKKSISENAHLELKFKPKILNKESGKGIKIINNNNLTSITKNRMIIKHGFFAKGTRSETYSRVGLSEEYKARSEGNLNKIIDLANGEPENVSLPIEKLHNIKQKLTLAEEEEISDGNNLSFLVTEKRRDEHPSIQMIDVKSQSSIFKSPIQQINLRNSSIGHISPIKFSAKSASTSQLNAVVLKTKPKPSEKSFEILGDYAKIYKEFTEHVNCEFKKYLPSKIVDSTVNLSNYLKAVHPGSSNENCALKDICHSNFSHNFSPQEPMLMDVDKTPENSALLNPIQYLRKVNANNKKNSCAMTLRKDVHHFRDPLNRQSVYKCGESNPKYIEFLNHCSKNNKLLNTEILCSPEVQYLQTGRATAQEADREKYSINTFSDNSPGRLMNCSYQNDDMFAIHVIDDTPEPKFYPRRMNPNK